MKKKEKVFYRRLVIPMVLVIAIAWGLLWTQLISFNAMLLLQFLGVSFVLVGNYVWVVLIDSVERWPNTNGFVRFGKLITFSRKTG